MNILAYEICPDAPDDYGVTSYICLLDDLIDHADDGKELRSKHILYNCLGRDEDVAQLFNEIGNGLVDPGAYKDVKDRIQEYLDSSSPSQPFHYCMDYDGFHCCCFDAISCWGSDLLRSSG